MNNITGYLRVGGLYLNEHMIPYTIEQTDQCEDNRVVLFYKDGSKHTFRKVDKVGHVKGGDNDLLKVYGQRSVTNTIEKDIVENGTLDYTVSIPRHLVSHYVVHSNEGVTKTERLVKVL